MKYFGRELEMYLAETLAQRPLVYLNGPRQTGKSTLVRNLHIKGETNYLSFDSPVTLAAAQADPAGFVRSLPSGKLNIIDEVQMAPEIFPYLKIAVDESRTIAKARSLYLLTGSANLMALPRLAEALVGRMSVLSLLPFSASEYMQGAGNAPSGNFIRRLFTDKLEYRSYRRCNLPEIIAHATFPEPALNTDIDRTRWFDDYLTTILQRDVRTVADIRNPVKTINLLLVMAMRAGSLLNNSQAAQDTGLDMKTYDRYKGAVLNTFIIFEIPAWAKPMQLNKRVIKSTKLFFTDTNLLAYLLRRDIGEIYLNDRTTMGHLFENFVAAEIMKSAAPLPDVTVSHFRTSDQKEVDFVIEAAKGDTIGIEVKLESTPDNHDFSGLKLLKEAVGKKFKRGIVLYTGTELLSWGDGLWAVPVSYLWEDAQ